MLEGEIKVLSVDTNCTKDRQMFKGKIVMTTYRVCFVPDDPSISFQLRLNLNYFDVPLAMVAK